MILVVLATIGFNAVGKAHGAELIAGGRSPIDDIRVSSYGHRSADSVVCSTDFLEGDDEHIAGIGGRLVRNVRDIFVRSHGLAEIVPVDVHILNFPARDGRRGVNGTGRRVGNVRASGRVNDEFGTSTVAADFVGENSPDEVATWPFLVFIGVDKVGPISRAVFINASVLAVREMVQ